MICRLCRKDALKQEYALTGQIKRSCVSIMANIAEGFGRYGLRESKQFYLTSRGSLAETQSHLYVLKDMGLITETEFDQAYTQSVITNKLINGLVANVIKYIGTQSAPKRIAACQHMNT